MYNINDGDGDGDYRLGCSLFNQTRKPEAPCLHKLSVFITLVGLVVNAIISSPFTFPFFYLSLIREKSGKTKVCRRSWWMVCWFVCAPIIRNQLPFKCSMFALNCLHSFLFFAGAPPDQSTGPVETNYRKFSCLIFCSIYFR